MRKFNCLVIDDEPLAIDVITHYIDKVDNLQVVDTYTNGLEAFTAIKNQDIDLIFLDIEMPEFTGLDLLKALKNQPEVIITTAYREYAVEGFELNVLDYLVKPIPFDRFIVAIDKFLERKSGLSEFEKEGDVLTVRADRKFINVNTNDLVYVEGLKDYVKLVQAGGQILTKQSIGKFATQLDDRFIRIHKSFIVGKSHIKAFSAQHVEVLDQQLPVGRTYKEHFMETMNG